MKWRVRPVPSRSGSVSFSRASWSRFSPTSRTPRSASSADVADREELRDHDELDLAGVASGVGARGRDPGVDAVEAGGDLVATAASVTAALAGSSRTIPANRPVEPSRRYEYRSGLSRVQPGTQVTRDPARRELVDHAGGDVDRRGAGPRHRRARRADRGGLGAHTLRHLVAPATDRRADDGDACRRRGAPASTRASTARSTTRADHPGPARVDGADDARHRIGEQDGYAVGDRAPRGRGRPASVTTRVDPRRRHPSHGPSARTTSAPWHWFMNSSRSRGTSNAAATAVRLASTDGRSVETGRRG